MNNFINPNLPTGEVEGGWQKTVKNLSNLTTEKKNKFEIIIVGCGLSGSSAAATLAEEGFKIKLLTYHDSPRRAHSVSAQGGINAARSISDEENKVVIDKLFQDTVLGGDFRAREASCQRLSELSSSIIDQCVSQGVPFAREYDGTLATRRFGGAVVSRTFYARGQTGQQLLYGAYQSLSRQVNLGNIELITKRDVLDLVIVNDIARGVVARNLINGNLETYKAHCVVLATGGYSNVYYLSTNSLKSNATAIWRAHKRGANFANPSFTQIHPTCIPPGGIYQSKLTLMSESLRNDGRIWLPKKIDSKDDPENIPEHERDYFLERQYPKYGNLVPRDVASRRAKEICEKGFGIGFGGKGVYLDLQDSIKKDGLKVIKAKYGNLLEMYERIVGEDPTKVPMKIYPAPHYTMGGLWVDYNLMSNIDGLFVLGEANYSVHGANRLGANALLQCLCDGYFISPKTITSWLANNKGIDNRRIDEACKEALNYVDKKIKALLKIKGEKPVDYFHRALGEIMISKCGISRNRNDLKSALEEVEILSNNFYSNLKIPETNSGLNIELEKALRLEDFIELSILMIKDAIEREESCGAHFREEYQTKEGEAKRNDDLFSHIAVWKFNSENNSHIRFSEDLNFKKINLNTRNYK